MCKNTTALFGDYSPSPDADLISTPASTLINLAKEHSIEVGCKDVSCSIYDANAIEIATRKADIIIVCLGTGM